MAHKTPPIEMGFEWPSTEMEANNKEHELDDSSQEDWYPVRIVHFINPHCFHFKLDDMVGAAEQQIDEALKEMYECQTKKCRAEYEPQEGEMVAAYIPTWNRWMRAQVDKVLLTGDSREYVVWCMDYGVSFRISKRFLYSLPDKAIELPVVTFAGALSSCLPSKKQIEFETLKPETVVGDNWGEYSVEKAISCIENASQIYFKPMVMYQNRIFGMIQILSYADEAYNLAELLCAKEFAMPGDGVIPNELHSMRTMLKPRFQNNKGQLNARNAEVGTIKPTPKKGYKSVSSAVSVDLNADDKNIMTWNKDSAEHTEAVFELYYAFHEKMDNIEVVERPAVEDIPHRHRFDRHKDSDLNNMSDAFGSQLTLASDISTTSNMSVKFGNAVMRFFEKPVQTPMQMPMQMPMQTLKPKQKPEPKPEPKRTYCPAGFERDLQKFAKYNDWN